MNNIGFGIFCFGEDYYYRGTVDKVKRILSAGHHCYILTENPEYFNQIFSSMYLHIIRYDRSFKSYADKMILPKYILTQHEIAVLIDADTHITNFEFLNKFKDYQFSPGITYVDTLKNHAANREFVKELINVDSEEWAAYHKYASKLYPEYGEFDTMWEYLLVINRNGFNSKEFYNHYERLQLAKEFSDLNLRKEINGAGEGISIQISAKLSGSNIQRDMDLYEMIRDKMISISRRHTRPELWPDWMR